MSQPTDRPAPPQNCTRFGGNNFICVAAGPRIQLPDPLKKPKRIEPKKGTNHG